MSVKCIPWGWRFWMQTVTWIEGKVPAQLRVLQVYGFIFDLSGRILLQDDDGHYNLPGGKPHGGETFVETLTREAAEESQVRFNWTNYLGYQHVQGEEEFAQVRYAALLARILPAVPDPATGREYRRLWVPPMAVNALLGWGESGKQQIEIAVKAVSALSVSWSGAPLITVHVG
jgi:ADP-ribose pyrophosphatase YjhB (NUDIX family)